MTSDSTDLGIHVLLSSVYPSALNKTVAASQQFVTEARVCLRHSILTRDLPGAETCQQTWRDVKSSYTAIDTTDPFLDCGGQCYQLKHVASSDALAPLVETVTSVSGQHFLARLELRDADGWRCRAIPSADDALLNARRPNGKAHLDTVNGVLADEHACFIPRDEQLAWTVDDVTYSLKAGAICVSRYQGETCYSIDRLKGVSQTDNHNLRLNWRETTTQTYLESVLETVRTVIESRPDIVPCPNAETCTKAMTILQSWLNCYLPDNSEDSNKTAT